MAAPTFSKDVAPIVYGCCASCHRPGEAAPMSLLSCEKVRPWARSIKDVVVERRMPLNSRIRTPRRVGGRRGAVRIENKISIDGGKLVDFGRPW